MIRRKMVARSDCKRYQDFAFKISGSAALRDRKDEARPVIVAKLQQIIDKGVWHEIHLTNLKSLELKAVIRSSMFLNDKLSASGAFDKMKDRLVVEGDQQNKELYDNLSSPTASTISVMAIIAIAANERKTIMVMHIGGAFLDITSTGIKV